MSKKEAIKKCLVDLLEYYETCGTKEDLDNHTILCQELGVILFKGN